MQLKKGNTIYYFAVPLQGIKIDRYNIDIPEQYGFCSLYYPKSLLDENDFIYFVKVYNHFSQTYSDEKTAVIRNKPLLFGESRFIPYYPERGEMKWMQLGAEESERIIDDFPDLKLCSFNVLDPPKDRNWWILKNGGLGINPHQKAKYEDVCHLEEGDETGEAGIKFRMYLHLIKNQLSEKISIDEWRDILFSIMREEPAAKKTSDKALIEGINRRLYDWLNYWE